ncbi:MAG: XdhC family protein [Steroidobacteraceae bacterium]
MAATIAPLLPLFERERAANRALVLATVVSTEGATYSKAGAQMLICANGEYAGLLSGGCLEGDLADRARQVLQQGSAQRVRYDARSLDDQLFGLGSGCGGAMDILLQRVDAGGDWQPLTQLAAAWQRGQVQPYGLVLDSTQAQWPMGRSLFAASAPPAIAALLGAQDAVQGMAFPRTNGSHCAMPAAQRHNGSVIAELEGLRVLLVRQPAPTRLLLLGAGPDAVPVAELAHAQGWRVSVRDHRPAYATAQRFAHAEEVRCARPEEWLDASLAGFAAAIVMTHHLLADLACLRVLARSSVPYVGLLGPPARRDRLLAELGADAGLLRPRLHAPVGLNIGADSPPGIALSIIAEVQAHLGGGPRT